MIAIWPMPDLTIIIPTYRREQHVRRAVDYWSQSDRPFIVVDGSPVAVELRMPSNGTYLHRPESPFQIRVSEGLELANSEYSVLCADDDFHAFTGLDECVRFLNGHPDFVSTQGRYLAFPRRKSSTTFEIYRYARELQIDGETIDQRLRSAVSPYMHVVYSVTRTSELRAAWSAMKNVSQLNALELGTALITLSAGKHRMLPIFYSARELGSGSGGATTEEIDHWVNRSERRAEVEEWKSAIAQAVSALSGDSLVTCRNLIDSTISSYCARASPSAAGSFAAGRLRARVRALAPGRVIGVVRTLAHYARTIRGAGILTLPRELSTVSNTALNDWARMRTQILRHPDCLS